MASALDDVLSANLMPARIVTELAAPEDYFVARYDDAPLLLIKLQPAIDQLERGLAASDVAVGTRVRPSVRAQAYAALADREDIRATLGNQPSAMTSATAGAMTNAMTNARVDRLRWLIRTDRYYVAPLRKRAPDDAQLGRVTVGRAVDNDVVLRHPNVSKMHAWFELDEHGGAYLADASSGNGTWLNQHRLAAHELSAVVVGHAIRFGSVEALLCNAGALWRAMRR